MLDNNQNIIDSRDLIEFIEDNRNELPADELQPYLDFAEEFEDYAEDYHYGAIAIRYDHFAEYARELVYDVGCIPDNLPGWIESNIDWAGVADDLEHDYSGIEFDGTLYLVR